MLSRIATYCKTYQILIYSPLRIKSLYLLSKFRGYIFNGLGEEYIWKLSPEILRVDLEGNNSIFLNLNPVWDSYRNQPLSF